LCRLFINMVKSLLLTTTNMACSSSTYLTSYPLTSPSNLASSNISSASAELYSCFSWFTTSLSLSCLNYLSTQLNHYCYLQQTWVVP
jgi:hypothetical protein